jgi:putative DNA primase/helicase
VLDSGAGVAEPCDMGHSPIIFTSGEVSIYYAARVGNLKEARGSERRGPCPIHGGQDDNFAVNPETGEAFCHSQCRRGWDVIGLEMELTGTDFRTAKAEVYRIIGRAYSSNGGRSNRARIVAKYDYRDEQGVLLYQVCRMDPKDFRQRQPNGNGFRWGINGVRRVLYRLPELLARNTEAVFVCEGEKDTDRLSAGGLVATCNPMGAGKWRAEYSDSLRGRSTVILPHNDGPGWSHGAGVAAGLLRVDCQVRVVEVPDGKDVSDWLAAGGTIEKLRTLAMAQPALTAETLATWRPSREAQVPVAIVPAELGHTKVNATKPFRLMGDAVIYTDPDPEKEPLMICGRLEVAALTRDAQGDGWGRLLKWVDGERRAHQWAMPMSLLAGDGSEYRARLLDGGLVISPGRKARDLLTTYIQSTRAEARALCVSRVGWHGDVFVVPSETIGASGMEDVLFQTPNESEHLLNVSGTVEDWRVNVGRLCVRNSRLVLAVSCSFAGPLLSLAGAESGGVHFHGPTSTGKSTALLVGGSVIGGGGRNGFVQSWRTTANGLEAVAELHNDLTLFLDELSQMDPREAAETAYLLGNGSGKARMTRNIGARKKLTWCLLFVSAGEVTLADHALTAGKRTKGGVEVRLLNVEADAAAGLGLFECIHGAESADAFSRRLRDAAKRYYGAPLRAYLAYVSANRTEVENHVRTFQADFVKRNTPAGASGEVSRAAQRFALIGAAGEIATTVGITGWSENESANAAKKCFANWLALRVGGTGAGDAEAAIQQVRNFIEVNGASRFQLAKIRRDGSGEPIPEKIISRAGFRVDHRDGEAVEYLILPEVFRREVCEGFDSRMVARALSERGYLDCQPPHLTKKPRLPEVGSVRVYAVRASILGE